MKATAIAPKTFKPPAILVCCWVALLAACSSPIAPTTPDAPVDLSNEDRALGTIAGMENGDPFIEIPDTVFRGESFAVLLTTFGSRCVRPDTTDVVINGQTAWVTPYDLRQTAAACDDVLLHHEHEATLSFAERGQAQVIVRGRMFVLGEGGRPTFDVITIEREVSVR